jgi:hypothetical protein
MWQGKAHVLGGAVESQQWTKPLSMHCNIFHICNLFRESAIVGNKCQCTITYKAQDINILLSRLGKVVQRVTEGSQQDKLVIVND